MKFYVIDTKASRVLSRHKGLKSAETALLGRPYHVVAEGPSGFDPGDTVELKGRQIKGRAPTLSEKEAAVFAEYRARQEQKPHPR